MTASSFNHGRRSGVNMVRLLQELRRGDEATPDDSLPLDPDFAMFTNTSFHDLDKGETTNFAPTDIDIGKLGNTSTADDGSAIDYSNFDISAMTTDFGFDFPGLGSSEVASFSNSLGALQPLETNPMAMYAPPPVQQQSPVFVQTPSQAGEKRKADNTTELGLSMTEEDKSRQAAEEDKRRRNTAASARFRIKKKQKEQQLEKSAKEMGEKITSLEGRIQQLETENKWLKNLIMEKNGDKEDIATMLKDLGTKSSEKASAQPKPTEVKPEN